MAKVRFFSDFSHLLLNGAHRGLALVADPLPLDSLVEDDVQSDSSTLRDDRHSDDNWLLLQVVEPSHQERAEE